MKKEFNYRRLQTQLFESRQFQKLVTDVVRGYMNSQSTYCDIPHAHTSRILRSRSREMAILVTETLPIVLKELEERKKKTRLRNSLGRF